MRTVCYNWFDEQEMGFFSSTWAYARRNKCFFFSKHNSHCNHFQISDPDSRLAALHDTLSILLPRSSRNSIFSPLFIFSYKKRKKKRKKHQFKSPGKNDALSDLQYIWSEGAGSSVGCALCDITQGHACVYQQTLAKKLKQAMERMERWTLFTSWEFNDTPQWWKKRVSFEKHEPLSSLPSLDKSRDLTAKK